MTTKQKLSPADQGAQAYLDWKSELEAEPDHERLAAEVAAENEQWWRIVNARKAAGLTYKKMAVILSVTPRQAAKLYDHGYDLYSVDELRQFADALDDALGLPHA